MPHKLKLAAALAATLALGVACGSAQSGTAKYDLQYFGVNGFQLGAVVEEDDNAEFTPVNRALYASCLFRSTKRAPESY